MSIEAAALFMRRKAAVRLSFFQQRRQVVPHNPIQDSLLGLTPTIAARTWRSRRTGLALEGQRWEWAPMLGRHLHRRVGLQAQIQLADLCQYWVR